MKRKQQHGLPIGSAKKVALPRFQREHWSRWLETVDDPETWKETFEEWQQETEERAGRLRQASLEVIRIDLDPDQFSEWCESRGYANDAEARNRYAAEQVGNIPPPAPSP